jgi:HPt (histidine-containing phosphotransfer) domain-containing protein
MANDPQPFVPVFSIDVSATEGTTTPPPQPAAKPTDIGSALIHLTRQLIEMQNRQNVLLEQLLQVNKQVLQANNQANQQRQNELNQWRTSHPRLVRSCKSALETLSSVQVEFLQQLADEVEDQKENLEGSEYAFNDFLDRYGPRMAHLNGVLQVLGHLSG